MTPSQFHRTILQADHFKTCVIGGTLLPWPKETVLWSRHRTWVSGHRVCFNKEVGAYSWQIYSPSWLKWGQPLDCLSPQGAVFSSSLPLQKGHYSVRTYTPSNTEILAPTCQSPEEEDSERWPQRKSSVWERIKHAVQCWPRTPRKPSIRTMFIRLQHLWELILDTHKILTINQCKIWFVFSWAGWRRLTQIKIWVCVRRFLIESSNRDF